jgi:hypothetical protein
MLSSIHPLGERARHNRWGLTVGAFTVVSTMAGAVVGAGLGWVGSLLVGSIEEAALLLGTAVLALTAGALDLVRVRPPGPERQVNEAWIGHYRGWVYGGAFGAELGIGVVTFVVTWGVYATYGAQLLSASPWSGVSSGSAAPWPCSWRDASIGLRFSPTFTVGWPTSGCRCVAARLSASPSPVFWGRSGQSCEPADPGRDRRRGTDRMGGLDRRW